MAIKRIIIYIMLLLPVASLAQEAKLSPFVRQAMMANKSLSRVSKAKSVSNVAMDYCPRIMAFVKTTDTGVLRKQGAHIYAQWDDIYIASIPLNRLSALATKPQIKRIEAGRSCSLTNDTTATITKAKEVWGLTPTLPRREGEQLTGDGVVVGVMDIGFDLTHPTFFSGDGKTYRIKQFWDQIDQTEGGEPVIGITTEGKDTTFVGRQYIGQEALLALQHSYDGLTQTHGTHTTGTAVGSGWQGNNSQLYSGMAPDADICLVCNMAGDNADMVPDSLQYLYTSATDMLGFKYIFDYADKVGKPCVISFSEGAHDDLYESGLYSEVLSKMLGPGHILCASAGNEGSGDGTYMHKAEGEISKGSFLAKWADNMAVYVLRSKKPVQMRLSFYSTSANMTGSPAIITDKEYDLAELADYPDSMMIDSVDVNGDTIVVYLETYPSCYNENLYATDFFIKDVNNERYGYSIPTSLTLLGTDNDIEAFCGGGYFTKNSLDSSLEDYDNTHNILFPGASKDVLCVGATAYVTSWTNIYGNRVGNNYGTDGKRAAYSSVGPALNELTKPDVMAPGTNVVSAFNSYWREAEPESNKGNDILHTTYNGRIYPWGMSTGTSMATPVVAGIVALWLQVCPTLSPDQIKDVIANTATHYDTSLTYPNNSYGCGQIDAMAGVEYIQKVYTGIQEVPSSKVQDPEYYYTIDGKRLSSIEGLHGIFIINRKKVVR